MIFKLLFKSDGLSLTEVLVTSAIIALLAGIAVFNYSTNYKDAGVKAAMKDELAELSKNLNLAHSLDGGYHHNIYTMGYKPSKSLVANVGFAHARGSAPKCSLFKSGSVSHFHTITQNSFTATHVDSSTQAEHICKAGHCTITDKVVTGALAKQSFTSGHSGCQTAFSKAFECDCDKFIIFSQSKTSSSTTLKMFTNQDGVFGFSDKDKHIDLYKR